MSIWSKFTGAGKKVVGSPISGAKKLLGVDQARENLTWMATIAKTLLPSSIKPGRVETFEQAMARQGVSGEDLDRIYTNHALKFWICVILLITGWGVGVGYLMQSQWLALLPLTGFTAICLSQMFAASFRAHQLAQRKFCDVAEWLIRKDAWVPRGFDLPPAPRRPGSKLSAKPPAKRNPPSSGGGV